MMTALFPGALDQLEVGGAELLPLGADEQGIGALRAASWVPHRVRSSAGRRGAGPLSWPGSYACTLPPAAPDGVHQHPAGASRMSSVLGLKASPQSAGRCGCPPAPKAGAAARRARAFCLTAVDLFHRAQQRRPRSPPPWRGSAPSRPFGKQDPPQLQPG